VDVADNFSRVDLTPRNAVKIGDRGCRHLQAFQFLLRNRVGNGPHITLNVSGYAKTGMGHGQTEVYPTS
jgi:hypothetical protein